MTNSPRTYHVCVLDRCAGLPTMAEEGQGTDNDADQGHEQAPEGRPTSLIASQHGMGSLHGSCLIERHADQRLRWSAPVWSPRRNRTGDPILTMEPPGPAVRTPFPQVTPDRRGRSYRFSFGQVMRSLQSRLIAAGAGHHPTQRSPTQPAFLFDHLPLALGRRPQQSSEYKGSSATRSPPGRPPPRSVRSMAMGMSSAGAAPRTRSARPRGR
jgi:hypothetical protein